jgi:hypothetical protein
LRFVLRRTRNPWPSCLSASNYKVAAAAAILLAKVLTSV